MRLPRYGVSAMRPTSITKLDMKNKVAHPTPVTPEASTAKRTKAEARAAVDARASLNAAEAAAKAASAPPREERIRQRALGAGLKARDGLTDVARFNLMLDPLSVAVLEEIGAGNLSLGAREAARRLYDKGDVEGFSESHHKRREKRLPKSN
jgi:hypothetical protein